MTGRSDYVTWYAPSAGRAVRRLTRALRALARHALELRGAMWHYQAGSEALSRALYAAEADVERLREERDEALAGSDRMHVRAAEFLSAHYASVAAADAAGMRARHAERERDEARIGWDGALDLAARLRTADVTARAEQAERERDEALAHELHIAQAVGIVHSPGTGDEHPGPRDAVLRAVCEASIAAAREAERRSRGRDDTTWCPHCGPHVAIDEDGACRCGADAHGDGADEAVTALGVVEDLRTLLGGVPDVLLAVRDALAERDAALVRVAAAEDEASALRAALREALDGWDALVEDAHVDSRDDHATIGRLRKLLPACAACPGRSACACPPGEMREGSVAP